MMRRTWIICLALLGLAAWLAADPADTSPTSEVSLPAPRTAPSARGPAAKAVAPPPALLPREKLYPAEPQSVTAPALFSSRPKPPAPSRAAHVSESAETPPPFPYSVVGWQRKAGRAEVFLVRDEYVFVVGEGDLIEADYRVVKVGPRMMSVEYTRLKHLHEIDLGDME